MTISLSVLICTTVILGLFAMVLFLITRVKKPSVAATILKAATSFFFILTSLVVSVSAGETYLRFCTLITAGLTCGLLGDIFLDLKYVYPTDSDTWTFAGFLSFMLGHFFYISAVLVQAGINKIALLCALVGVILAVVFIVLGEKPMKLHYGKFKTISAVYGGILFFTAVFTTVSGIVTRNTGVLMMGVGGVLFLVSDLILSGTYFGEGKNRPVDVITNHVTYYLAQFVIALSAMFLVKTF